MKRKIVTCEHCEKQNYEARIAELERRVKELEAQPRETHTHFHTYPPVYQQPYVWPLQPMPTWDPLPWRITCGDPALYSNSTITLDTSTGTFGAGN